MENKKKTIFNVIFLLVVFAGTMYGVFHGEDIGEIVKILGQVNVLWRRPWRNDGSNAARRCAVAAAGTALCRVFYLGRIDHYLLYDADTENPAEKMDMFSVFIGWILLQLYHTFGIWRTAGTDLLYEKRKDTNTGFDAGADDRYDHL